MIFVVYQLNLGSFVPGTTPLINLVFFVRPMFPARLLLVFAPAVTTVAAFNFTVCPSPAELQSLSVQTNFSLDHFSGTYYELVLHDYTQYPACPEPTCVRSIKRVAQARVADAWQMSCFGGTYPEALFFNLSSTPGYFFGTWDVLPHAVFPDIVVDVGPLITAPSGAQQYEWVIEFQCVQVSNSTGNGTEVVFTGINFYHYEPTPGNKTISLMLDAARARGLSVYMDHGFGLYTVPQTNCSWDMV